MTEPTSGRPGSFKNANPSRFFISQGTRRHPHVVLGLQVHPEPWLHAEKQAQPHRSDRAIPIDQVADAAGQHVKVCGQLACGYAHRFHVVFRQDFAGVNLVN